MARSNSAAPSAPAPAPGSRVATTDARAKADLHLARTVPEMPAVRGSGVGPVRIETRPATPAAGRRAAGPPPPAVTRPELPAAGAVRPSPPPPAQGLPAMPAVRPGGRGMPPRAPTRSEMPAVRELPVEPTFELEGDRITRISDAPAAVSARDRSLLLRLDGTFGGELVSLGTEAVTIGRDQDNTLVVDDAGVSRRHVRIRWLRGRHVLEDGQSKNGTYVRGRRVSEAALADGDIIQLGPRVCLRYTVTDELHERLLRQLYESSTLDALTNIGNRRYFESRLASELSYAKRHGSELSVVIFDIDHFKRVNDTHGHLVGDNVIRHVARIAREELRSEDVLARYGGEEFVALLRHTDLKGAVCVADRIRATVAVLPIGAERVSVTVSGGCASLAEREPSDGAALLARADERLYLAKSGGRNRVVGRDAG